MKPTKARIEELFQGLLGAAVRSDNMSAGAHAIIGRGAALPGEDPELLLALFDRNELQTQKALDDWNDEKISEAELAHRARLLASVDAYLVARLKHYDEEAPERLILDCEQLDPIHQPPTEIPEKAFPLDTSAELAGQDFGRLHTIGVIGKEPGRGAIYLCRCTCGSWRVIRRQDLATGKSQSCGCARREKLYRHGGTGSRLFSIWHTMKDRCCRPQNTNYRLYGGRGIRVCDEWKNDFESFRRWALSNGYSDELTLDRIDNDGDYEPNNCRWCTPKEQSNNTRQNVLVEYRGELLTLKQAAEASGISYSCLKNRRRKTPGITEEELFRPPKWRRSPSGSDNKKSERPEDRPQK